MKNILIAFSFLIVLFSGCSNELDIIAPQEEVMVVYGLLNVSDSVQYIKINKGFASEDQAPIILAQDPDQLFFDSLFVTLIDKSNNVAVTLNPVSMDKNAGIFNNTVNYVYATTHKLTANRNYGLKITNLISGKVVTATLELVGPPEAKSPNNSTINVYPIESGKLMTINYDADIRAAVYEIRLNFIFEEINSSTNEVRLDTLPWVISTGKFNGQRRILLRLDGQLFYDHLAATLEKKGPEITRRGKHLEFEYWSGDKELSTFIDVYGSSSIGVVQKKADYTNITGGYGIFAGRNSFKITGTTLDSRVKNELKTNAVLSPFRFVD
ncbi:MAG: DUF4249 domain-containing protein [Bacteroidia bacterium]